ncbi:ATP-binding cassette domain-containing protein [Rossellomorea vietnamensis]|uniref:ATP-binding cassette domain-containing protein n=1 Tax=Rossellomorea vietnamensis TaxID=218284 RepID=UPI00077C7353|nr:ABC transporter ATP-binding protein [Rossellomorea vietnamensis]
MQSNMAFLFSLYKRQTPTILLFTLTTSIMLFTTIGIPLVIKYIIDSVSEGNYLEFFQESMDIIIIGILVYISLIYLNIFLENSLSVKSNLYLRREVNQVIRKSKYTSLISQKSNIIQLITNDIPVCQGIFNSVLLNLMLEIIIFITTFFILLSLNVKFTLILVCFLPVYFFIYRYYNRKIKNNSSISLDLRDDLTSVSQRIQNNLMVYKTSNNENPLYGEYSMSVNNISKNQKSRGGIVAGLSVVTTLLFLLISLFILYFGLLDVENGRLSYGEFVACILYIFRFFTPLRRISDYFVKLKVSLLSVERVKAFLNNELEVSQVGQQTVFSAESKQDISLDDSRVYIENAEIIKGITGSIRRGNINILKGENAIGKTTLVLSLLKLYQSENIFMDNININSLPNKDLRESIGVVFQTPEFLSTTVKEELDHYRKYFAIKESSEKLKEIVEEATRTLLKQLPLNSEIQALSGGKKQLLSIVCQLNKLPNILILDEAMANLDSNTKNRVIKVLIQLQSYMNIIVIEHNIQGLEGNVLNLSSGVNSSRKLEVVT